MVNQSTWQPDKIRLAVTRDLRAIVDMCSRLDTEAGESGASKDPADIDALNLLGPVANVEAWQHRYDATERVGGNCDYASDQVAELHPLLVLATWEDIVREEVDQPTDLRATIERAAEYLAGKVDWMLADDEFGNLNFLGIDALARDLRDCKGMLEDVLKEGFRSDTGAPCIECGKALVKVWTQAESLDNWRCRNRDCDEFDEPVSGERYNQAVKAGYLANSETLTATDMLAAYRIKAGTLTGWATKGLVRKRGKSDDGRVLYDVADALAQRDKKPIVVAA